MKVPLEPISFVVVVLSCLTFVDSKGGNGGGGGGRGGGGGARGSFGRSGGSRGISRTRAGGAAVILGSGAAGYAAYRAHQNSKKDRERGEGNPDFDSFEQYGYDPDGKFDYKTQESTSYYASEGIGMSAWALIFLILAVVALGTVGYYCCTVFLPVWQDNRQIRRRSMMGRMKDEVPLQETPSTATPSP